MKFSARVDLAGLQVFQVENIRLHSVHINAEAGSSPHNESAHCC